jgi:hypothetical protein
VLSAVVAVSAGAEIAATNRAEADIEQVRFIWHVNKKPPLLGRPSRSCGAFISVTVIVPVPVVAAIGIAVGIGTVSTIAIAGVRTTIRFAESALECETLTARICRLRTSCGANEKSDAAKSYNCEN